MAYVTYKGRTSHDYRFTVDSLNDPEIANLKKLLTERNGYIKRARKINPLSYYGKQPTQGIRIRPRGPRKGNSTGIWGVYYDTPIENATRFDVYIRDYK